MSREFPFDHFLKVDSQPQLPGLFGETPNQAPEKEVKPPKKEVPQGPKITRNQQDLLVDGPKTPSKELQVMESEVLNYIKSIISPQKYNAFFDSTFFLTNIYLDKVEFSVTTPFIKTMIYEHYLPQIQEAIFSILGKDYNIDILISQSNQSLSSNDKNILNSIKKSMVPGKPAEAQPQIAPALPKKKRSKESLFPISLSPNKNDRLSKVESKYISHMNPDQTGIIIDVTKTFDNFVIGPSNNLAYATAKAVAQTPGKDGKYPSLYIYSHSGLGKTHLLHSVANGIRNGHPSLVVRLVTARDFMNEMINAIQNNKISDFRKSYSEKIDVLMIDDIHELKDRQGTQNEFFHIFNELHTKGKQLIFTSDKSPQEIDGIAERIKTRLQWGLVIDIQRPDIETRLAILKKKAYELDLFCPDDVLQSIATSITTSIRELEGFLIKLSAYSDVMKVEIDHEVVKDQLNLVVNSTPDSPSLEHVAQATAKFFNIPLVDLKSRVRSKKITRARHIAMFLSRKVVKTTQQEIGRFFGGRDHTSVLHAINKINETTKSDNTLAQEISEIEGLL